MCCNLNEGSASSDVSQSVLDNVTPNSVSAGPTCWHGVKTGPVRLCMSATMEFRVGEKLAEIVTNRNVSRAVTNERQSVSLK